MMARVRSDERGFSLLETVVAVALIFTIGGAVFERLAARPMQMRSTVTTFAELIAQARSLAAITGSGHDGSDGASIGVTRDGDAYVATLYAYRPAKGASHAPEREPNLPPLHTTTAIALGIGASALEAPFALFFSAAGHASAQPGFTIGITPPLEIEPRCNATVGISLTFADTNQMQTHVLSCQMAQLDLDEATTNVNTGGPYRLP